MGKPKGEPRAAWADGESVEDKKKRAAKIRSRLAKAYPDAKCALLFETPLQILVATVLSAQCTDAKVNEVTRTLFKKYRTPQDYLASKPGELEQDIHQTGFFNQKAKSIRGLSQKLLNDFGGEVPKTMAEILTLPGVARKTGNVVLGNAYGVVEGIAIDTHMHRLSWRLALSDQDDPNKVERELMALFPKRHWLTLTYLLIDHGRAVCYARNPRCGDCVINALCPARRVP